MEDTGPSWHNGALQLSACQCAIKMSTDLASHVRLISGVFGVTVKAPHAAHFAPPGLPCAPNARNRKGECALYLACRSGLVAVARALIDAGARRSYACMDGETPLHAAAARGRADIVSLLLLHEELGAPASRGPGVLGPGLRSGIGDDGRGTFHCV